MSTKKEKLLESAQKFIQKGQIDRAIKDYEQIVALDPSDQRYRQRLAELLGMAVEEVNVKAKTGERVGHIGRAEAIGCQAVALIEEMVMEVRGRDQVTGLPRTVTVNSTEVTQAITDPVMAIVATAMSRSSMSAPRASNLAFYSPKMSLAATVHSNHSVKRAYR